MAAPDLRALEAAILADPEDPAGYVVYADALQAAGDPRGELIALQAARAADPSSSALALAAAELIARHPQLDAATGAVDWYYGFWRGLYLVSRAAADVRHDDQAAQLLASPSAKFLRVLHCGSSFTPRVLVHAATRAATLRELTITLHPQGAFTDDDLASLAPLTRLRRLSLSSCAPVTAAGLGVLGDLHELERVWLRDCEMTDGVARVLGALPLTDMMFTSVALSADGMRALARAPLRRLYLSTERVDDAMIEPFAAHPALINLHLNGAQLTAAGLGAVGRMPRLRRLWLASNGLDGSELAQLAPLAGQLESLNLNHSSQLSNRACEVLAGFARLAFLDVSGTAITGPGLRQLCRIGTLEQLDLSFLSLDDADLAALVDLPGLRGLNLAYTQLTDRTVDTLLRLRQLERLDVGGTQITAAGIERLAALPALTDLGLSECDDDALERAHARAQWHVSEMLTLQDEREVVVD